MKESQEKFFSILCENDFTSEIIRRFFLVILGDEAHGVLRLTKPGSPQHTAVSNVIALLNDNCNDKRCWRNAETAAWAAAIFAVQGTFRAAARTALAIASREAWAEWTAKSAARAAAAWDAGEAWAAAAMSAWNAAAWEARDAFGAAVFATPEAAGAAAREAHYQWMADAIIQLQKELT